MEKFKFSCKNTLSSYKKTNTIKPAFLKAKVFIDAKHDGKSHFMGFSIYLSEAEMNRFLSAESMGKENVEALVEIKKNLFNHLISEISDRKETTESYYLKFKHEITADIDYAEIGTEKGIINFWALSSVLQNRINLYLLKQKNAPFLSVEVVPTPYVFSPILNNEFSK